MLLVIDVSVRSWWYVVCVCYIFDVGEGAVVMKRGSKSGIGRMRKRISFEGGYIFCGAIFLICRFSEMMSAVAFCLCCVAERGYRVFL